MFSGSDLLSFADPAQLVATAGEVLDDLDRDVLFEV